MKKLLLIACCTFISCVYAMEKEGATALLEIPSSCKNLRVLVNATATNDYSLINDAARTLKTLQKSLSLFPKEDDKYRAKTLKNIKYLITYIDQQTPKRFPIEKQSRQRAKKRAVTHEKKQDALNILFAQNEKDVQELDALQKLNTLALSDGQEQSAQ